MEEIGEIFTEVSKRSVLTTNWNVERSSNEHFTFLDLPSYSHVLTCFVFGFAGNGDINYIRIKKKKRSTIYQILIVRGVL